MPLRGKEMARVIKTHEQPRRHFSSVWNEGLMYRGLAKIGKFLSGLALIGVICQGLVCMSGCSTQDETVQPEVFATGKAVTGKDGTASFDANGRTFNVNVYDYETREPISGLSVEFSVRGEFGIAVITDPQDRYITKMANLGGTLDYGITDGSLTYATKEGALEVGWNTNVIMNKTENACGLGNYEQITGAGIDELYQQKNDGQSVLNSKFKTDNQKVKLKNLDSDIEEIITEALAEIAVPGTQEMIDKAKAKMTVALLARVEVKLGLAEAGAAIEAIAVLAEYCEDKEKRSWKRYYEGLGYGPDDEFIIYKNKDTETPFELLKNPLLIVLPVDSKDKWVPKTAVVTGTVKTSLPDWPSLVYMTEKDGGIFPTIYQPLMAGLGTTSAKFLLVVGTDLQNKMPYTLGVKTGLVKWSNMTLTPSEQEVYEWYSDFSSCVVPATSTTNTSYKDADKDKFGSKYRIRSACEPLVDYIPDNQDCDDSDPTINPKGKEVCGDKKDNDCNGQVDEGCSTEGELPGCGIIIDNLLQMDRSTSWDLDSNFVAISTIAGTVVINLKTKETVEIESNWARVGPYLWKGKLLFMEDGELTSYDIKTGQKNKLGVYETELMDFNSGVLLMNFQGQLPPPYSGKCPADSKFTAINDDGNNCMFIRDLDSGEITFVKRADLDGLVRFQGSPKLSSNWLAATLDYGADFLSSGGFVYNLKDGKWYDLGGVGARIEGDTEVFHPADFENRLVYRDLPEGAIQSVYDGSDGKDTKYDIYGDDILFSTSNAIRRFKISTSSAADLLLLELDMFPSVYGIPKADSLRIHGKTGIIIFDENAAEPHETVVKCILP